MERTVREAPSNIEDLNANPVSFVNRDGASVASDQRHGMRRRGRGDQGVINRPACYIQLRQTGNKLAIGGSGQPQPWIRKTRRNEIAHHACRRPVRRRQARKYGIRLERAMLHKPKAIVQSLSRGIVLFVP